MKVVSYISSVPSKNNNKQKTELLLKYAEGVKRNGDDAIVHNGGYIDSDVGVIQGWVYADTKPPHLTLRKQVIDNQIAANKFVISADANLFLYHNKTNPHGYLRYSFNGIFPNTGIYCDNNPTPDRWKQIQKDTGIVLEDYKSKGKHIVLCLQRNGGWSMDGLDIQDWVIDTVKKIRKHSDRTIIIRPHPGDKKAVQYLNHRYNRIKHLPNVILSDFGTPLEADLNKAWCVVNHNSSSIVGPVIQGYHAFVTDPVRSQCAEVAHTDFSKIENPDEFDRQAWLERISMFHWKFSELEDGSCWRHMRNYCQ